MPGVFATLDAGAKDTLAIYFMYDVKHYDPAEWSSPPLEGRIVDRPGEGKAMVGRGAVNQKGPETAFLTALRAFKTAGVKLPVNLVLVAEGEEEIASPHFPQVVNQPEVRAALEKAVGIIIPSAGQSVDGAGRRCSLGAKGAVELQLISSGEKWGRGPNKDIHSSLMANVDSPAWHLVKALNTLVAEDGHTPAIDGWFENVKPLTARQKELIAADVAAANEADDKKVLGIKHWYKDEDYLTAPSGLPRSRRSTSRAWSAAIWGRAARPSCRAAPRPRSTSAGARHDQGRGGVEAEGAPRQARLRRHRGQCQRRLRPDPDRREQRADPGRAGDARRGGDPDDHVGAHRREAGRAWCSPARRSTWPAGQFGGGPRRRRPCARRMVADRKQQPQGAGFDEQAMLYADFLYEVARPAQAKR